ncbi:hypothetical protein SAMN02746089_00161 [Caldanaerobius fijiensis DSM 17918]|uniref:Uncharacterized protein n=2 Tax=Caldanaerobius TaxID=862261 RepID=A0A1M4SY91_9THEO|nr:hypothetical protein SAMN02746089_00161 [Caldanaerobius fijiensis DSM 17918]
MNNEELAKFIEKKLDDMGIVMEKLKLVDYMELLQSPWRLFWLNFIGGVYRGLGMAVGFTILGAIVIYFLQKLVTLNIPVIGNVIAQIVKIVQQNL